MQAYLLGCIVLIPRFLIRWRYCLCIPVDVFCISALLWSGSLHSCRSLIYYLDHFWCMIEFRSLSCNICINWKSFRLIGCLLFTVLWFCFSKRCPVKFQISLLNDLDIWFKFWNVGSVVETMGTACKFNMKEMRWQKVCEMEVKEPMSLGLNDVSILPQKGCRSGFFQLYYWVF